MKDEFLKIPKGLYRIPMFNHTDIMILSTFMEAWRLHKYKPFTYRLDTMARELNVATRTLSRSKGLLLSMGLISQSYGKDKVCWYTINERVIRDLVDKFTIKSIIESYGDAIFQADYDATVLLKECASECGRDYKDKEFQELVNKIFNIIKNGKQNKTI